jgi:hypothetical protein
MYPKALGLDICHFNIDSFAYNRIGGVMVSVLATRVVDHGFESKSGKTKDYKIDFCCFFIRVTRVCFMCHVL